MKFIPLIEQFEKRIIPTDLTPTTSTILVSTTNDPLPDPEPSPGPNPGLNTPVVPVPLPPAGPIGPGTS